MTVTWESVSWLLISSWLLGCSVATQTAEEPSETEAEPCQPDVRNDEWSVDCPAACNHGQACRSRAAIRILRR